MNLMQRRVISNLVGFGFVAVSWIAVILISEVSEGLVSWPLPWLLGSLLLIVLDVGYRGIRSKRGRQADQVDGASSRFWTHWLTPTRGASLIVFPVWIMGTVSAAVFAVLSVRDLLWTNGNLPMIG